MNRSPPAELPPAGVARLTQEDWQRERDKMIATCKGCHSGNFALEQLAKGDDMIRQVDRLMAEAPELSLASGAACSSA